MLFIVPTPIGNLRDITFRAVDILKSCDFIICEDTRQTRKLLDAYEIQKTMISFHEHSAKMKIEKILYSLREGQSAALVSDGGTPLISDPGFELVRAALREGIQVESLPGPCALITALAASGLAVDSFSFFGFPPAKPAGRRNFFSDLKEREETLIFYESPFRVLQTLNDMKEIFGEREAVVGRELTKKFEEYQRGTLTTLIENFSKKKAIGEFVILVSGAGRKAVL
ncbi:MAG: 16S rRNA (cytidine(1402)-2'-O)-methyltransferase [Candidatus Omnitrophica bacterium]|nr:16S rRNA (cytidine(1402)-2'-O)-methyltransferase [Candidatus Omnitrophota bacterium]